MSGLAWKFVIIIANVSWTRFKLAVVLDYNQGVVLSRRYQHFVLSGPHTEEWKAIWRIRLPNEQTRGCNKRLYLRGISSGWSRVKSRSDGGPWRRWRHKMEWIPSLFRIKTPTTPSDDLIRLRVSSMSDYKRKSVQLRQYKYIPSQIDRNTGNEKKFQLDVHHECGIYLVT